MICDNCMNEVEKEFCQTCQYFGYVEVRYKCSNCSYEGKMIENLDDKVNELFKKGRKLIIEMDTDFKPYLEILVKRGITNPKEVGILFGMYLESKKEDHEGYKTISKSGFEKFLTTI
ncbi:hypothetical protein NK358_29260 [Bacillus sp. S0635]|uniref:hypothetical protein n=1 Tax=Bacillus sp. S0635 TaxID=2957807 RepID=UPI0020A224D0|nr:hypothetical protein [Bacillus sp. S0635]MCP1285687.1 hypothetical protein [Bacillus sp. S0635]